MDKHTMSIKIKRVYDKPEPKDGKRILVDRLWPRGLSKSKAQIELWIKDVAPSNELRRWYKHDRQKWPEFKKKYFAELDTKSESVNDILNHIHSEDVVLLYSSKETVYNNAVALKEYIELLR